MNTQKRLEHFLQWVDEKTYWKEDMDVPNHVIVREYMNKFKLEDNVIPKKSKRTSVRKSKWDSIKSFID